VSIPECLGAIVPEKLSVPMLRELVAALDPAFSDAKAVRVLLLAASQITVRLHLV
jgi:hypothetical protein